MSDMNPERIAELRRIAEAATPGPWGVNPWRAVVDEMETLTPICGMLWPTELRTEEQTLANAQHIATFDPPTVLALLDEIELLRRERGETHFALYHPDFDWWECQACRFWWEFESGDPYEHDMRFCPRCGRRIVRRGDADTEGGDVDAQSDAS